MQEALQNNEFGLYKVDGERNVADLGTKHLERKRMCELLVRMGLEFRERASSLALQTRT